MTILKCSAIKCVYNKDQLCSKGKIDVTGENATNANETSCGSSRNAAAAPWQTALQTAADVKKSRLTAKLTTVPITMTANVPLPLFR